MKRIGPICNEKSLLNLTSWVHDVLNHEVENSAKINILDLKKKFHTPSKVDKWDLTYIKWIQECVIN